MHQHVASIAQKSMERVTSQSPVLLEAFVRRRHIGDGKMEPQHPSTTHLGLPADTSQQVLLYLVLFEMLHHEFHHHLVESAAPTIEIMAHAMGMPVSPSYNTYRIRVHEGAFHQHRHKLLEEALANAYAFHGLPFISRVKAGYRDALVGCYQRGLEAHWRYEGPEYRDAGAYLSGAQVDGNGKLLAMILGYDPEPEWLIRRLQRLQRVVRP